MGDSGGWLRLLVEPLAGQLGVEIVDAQVRGSGAKRVVRVVVDRKGGVDLAACQELSRRLSALLDDADPVEGRYELVVTSPGIDRPLADRDDFDRVEGRRVLVHASQPDGGVRQVAGTVTAAEDEVVVLDVDGDALRVPYREIVKATQALPW